MGDASLYDTDFFAWTQEQATALRELARERSNLPLDWENLAEEVEDLGKSLRRELHSRIALIIEHLLKVEYSSAQQPRAGWMDTIDRERREIKRLLKQNPSLRRDVPETIADEGPGAVEPTARSLERYGEADAAAVIRAAGTRYTAEQVLGDWWPEQIRSA